MLHRLLMVLAAALIAAPLALIERAPSRTALQLYNSETDLISCSGSVPVKREYLLTAAHCHFDHVVGNVAHPQPIWSDREKDVALWKVPRMRAAPTPLSCEPLQIGDEIELIGNPIGEPQVHTFGRVASNVRSLPPYWETMQFAAATLIQGMSGGPVLDRSGVQRAIGVGYFTGGRGANIAIIVPTSAICERLKESIK